MIKKLFFYSLILFTLVLSVSGSFYTYKVYYLKKPNEKKIEFEIIQNQLITGYIKDNHFVLFINIQ